MLTDDTVSMAALLKRINRHLRKYGEQLRTARGEQARVDFGKYYIVVVERNFVRFKHVDPVELGRELGVLETWEKVVED
jgi:hypothetical protein